MATNNLTGTDSYLFLNKIGVTYGKRLDNWTRLASTKALLQAFRSNPLYGGTEPIITSKGGLREHPLWTADEKDRGTLVHPDIAIEFEKWCQKPSPSESKCVYLIWAVGSDMFKIGIAKDPSFRLKNLQIGSPLKLAISRVCFCCDPAGMEIRLHSRFKKYHSHGEWFEVESATAITLFDQVTKAHLLHI